jgi:hypothetical protein
MKLIKILLLISLAFASNAHKLGVFGDPGQFDVLFPYAVKPADKKAATIKVEYTPETTNDCKINKVDFNTMTNWQGVLASMGSLIKTVDQAVILGDMVYPESKFTSGPFAAGYWRAFDNKAVPKAYWEARLKCAWGGFFAATKGSIDASFIAATKFSAKLQMIPGNHLYDVNPGQEVGFMSAITTDAAGIKWFPSTVKTPTWLNAVRLQKIEDGEQNIYYLDFNSAVFETAVSADGAVVDGKDATKALAAIKVNLAAGFWNQEGITAEDVYSTLEGVFAALAEMKKDTGKPTIKVLRAHHPPFNLEGDFNGMFQYKSSTGMTFLEACSDAGVHLYLASHHHSSQIWSYEYAKSKALIGKLAKGKAEFAGADAYNCFPKDCKAYTLSTGITLKTPKYLVVLLIGNSGRFFDPITPATNSYGNFLFGRANNGDATNSEGRWRAMQAKNYYGGAIIEFLTVKGGATTITANIYEVTDKTKAPTVVATVKFDSSAKSDAIARRRRAMKK